MKPQTILHSSELLAQTSRPGQQPRSADPAPFQRVVVSSNAGEDAAFVGRLIGFVSGSPSQENLAAEERVANATELRLYMTPSGDYVCHEVIKSALLDEPTQNRVRIIECLDRHPPWSDGTCPPPGTVRLSDQELHKRVRQFFGKSSLAKQLYVEADIAGD